MELVSVIIPVYNVESYISKCLNSIISQSYSNLDIIIINDGSIDNTLLICNNYAQNDKRIRIFSQNNSGVSVARNLGIDKIQGKYFVFVDGDDYIGEHHIYNLYNSICKNNSDICIGSCSEIFNEKIIYKNNELSYIEIDNIEAILNMVYRKHFGGEPWAKLFSTNLLKATKSSYFDIYEKIGEDFSFCCNMFHVANKICICEENTYFYVRRPNSATRASVLSSLNRIKSAKKYKNFIEKYYSNNIQFSQSLDYYFSFCYLEVINRIIDSRDGMKYIKLIKILSLRIKAILGNVLLNRKVSIKLKLKLLLFVININLYRNFRNKYLHTQGLI